MWTARAGKRIDPTLSELLLFVTLLALGPLLLATGLLARYELMVYAIGPRAPAATLPPGVPYARGADPGRPPAACVVYLDGIGKRRFTDTRDGGQFVKAVIAGAPELRVLGQVLPPSSFIWRGKGIFRDWASPTDAEKTITARYLSSSRGRLGPLRLLSRTVRGC